MVQTFSVIGETITFATPDGLDFFSNGEWYEIFYFKDIYVLNIFVFGFTILVQINP